MPTEPNPRHSAITTLSTAQLKKPTVSQPSKANFPKIVSMRGTLHGHSGRILESIGCLPKDPGSLKVAMPVQRDPTASSLRNKSMRENGIDGKKENKNPSLRTPVGSPQPWHTPGRAQRTNAKLKKQQENSRDMSLSKGRSAAGNTGPRRPGQA